MASEPCSEADGLLRRRSSIIASAWPCSNHHSRSRHGKDAGGHVVLYWLIGGRRLGPEEPREFVRPTVRQARVTRIARIKIKPRISRSYFHDNPPCPYRSYVTSRDLLSSVIPFRAIRGFVLIRAIRVILTKAIPRTVPPLTRRRSILTYPPMCVTRFGYC